MADKAKVVLKINTGAAVLGLGFIVGLKYASIICAGSLLGIALHRGTSFPVGKVDFLKLYPLSFREFLMATGKERFAELLDSQDHRMIASFRQMYIDALKHYYFVGGMPEAVQSFAESMDFNEVREIQKRILAAYEQDFSKHAPNALEQYPLAACKGE